MVEVNTSDHRAFDDPTAHKNISCGLYTGPLQQDFKPHTPASVFGELQDENGVSLFTGSWENGCPTDDAAGSYEQTAELI